MIFISTHIVIDFTVIIHFYYVLCIMYRIVIITLLHYYIMIYCNHENRHYCYININTTLDYTIFLNMLALVVSKMKNIAIIFYSSFFQIDVWPGREEVVSRHLDAGGIESDVHGASGCGGREIERS